MKILIVGSGGREHALFWKCSEEGHEVFCAPGNGGIPGEVCVPIPVASFAELAQWAKEQKAFTIVGPEQPLSEGIVDFFEKQKLPIFGTTQKGARIESSKVFTRELCKKYHIPGAEFTVCSTRAEVESAVQALGIPCVVKVDGLAAGKGVFVCQEEEEVAFALRKIYEEEAFGKSAEKVVVEEFLEGEEFSFFGLCEKDLFVPLSFAKDYKRLLAGDKGPNTGGMGCLSPVPFIDEDCAQRCREIMQTTLHALAEEGAPYSGFLYLGGMLTSSGPRVLEFNCRLGDPETQVLLPRLSSSLVEAIQTLQSGRKPEVRFSPSAAVCIVAASEGYPYHPKKGMTIEGIEKVQGALLFHAGTKRTGDKILTSGGRVLSVVALGETLEAARDKALQEIAKIYFPGMQFRHDIAKLSD